MTMKQTKQPMPAVTSKNNLLSRPPQMPVLDYLSSLILKRKYPVAGKKIGSLWQFLIKYKF